MANRYWITTAGGLWSSSANWSTTSGGASGASVPLSTDSVFFDQAGTYSVTVTSQNCLDLNVSAGTVTFTGTASSFGVYGNINLTVPIAFSTVTLSLNGATGGSSTLRTIRSSGTVFEGPVTVDSGGNGTSVAWQLLDNFTAGTTRLFTLTNGKWDINGFTFSTGQFSSNSATNLRAVNYGAAFYLTGSGTVWQTSTALTTGTFTPTGTPLVTVLNPTATATTISTGPLSEANSISFKLQSGTYVATTSTGSTFKNFELAGPSMTNATTITIYGNFVFTSGTIANGGIITFGATSGTKTITSNGNTIDQAVTINGVGGTYQLSDALTMGSTRTLTLTNGTLDLNNKSLTVNAFNTNNANVRTLAFGTTGAINVTGVTAPWPNPNTTNFTVTGISTVNITNNTATTTTITTGTPTEAQALNFNFTAGTYALVFLNAATYAAKNVNFTGFAGTWSAVTTSRTLYGSLTLSSGMSFGSSSGVLTFAATSGTQVITTNAKTLDEPVVIDGVGGTFQLGDNLAMGSTRALTLTNGTFDGNSKTISGSNALSMLTGSIVAKNISTALQFTHTSGTLTQGGNNSVGAYQFSAGILDLAGYTLTMPGSFGISGASAKNITFNGGTITISNVGGAAFSTIGSSSFTSTAGTGIGYIRMTSNSSKTFGGNSFTYACILSNDGSGALTISGSNTFLGITNGVSPTAFIFTSGTTQTTGSWTVSGTAGNLVTITSTTAGSAANLVKTGGGTVSSNYLSLKDSAATPSTLTWYAGANSTNVSGNSGWIFTNLPSTANGNFFFMF